MGISCASEIFTEEIRKLLIDLPGQMNMTDDVLIKGDTKEDHHKNLMAVLKRLEEHGHTANKNKCEFFKKELTFFGLRFTDKGISPTEERCRTLK